MPKNPPELTAERLRELLSYDPDSGLFRWRVTLCSSARAGKIASCKDRHGYVRIGIHGESYRAHRLAWLYVHGEWPEDQIDHINGVRDANWIANLREASHTENQQNHGLSRRNKSGHQGVVRHRQTGKWQAQIKAFGINRYLGLYETPEAASDAYQRAKAEMHPFQPVPRSISQRDTL